MKSIAFIQQQLVKIGHDDLINIEYETQNAEYEGARFNLDQCLYRSRLAKRTAKKTGYFVVFWEKDGNNKNQPYLFRDSPDKLVVSIVDKEKMGQFVFPKAVLHDQGILKSETSKGKMAIRVYPTWEEDLNPSATKTKK